MTLGSIRTVTDTPRRRRGLRRGRLRGRRTRCQHAPTPWPRTSRRRSSTRRRPAGPRSAENHTIPCGVVGPRPPAPTRGCLPSRGARSVRGPRSSRSPTPAWSSREPRYRVVDVDHHSTTSVRRSGQRHLGSQPDQEPGGHRIELADMAEGERAQERTQRRGRVGVGEDPDYPAMSKQCHVIDAFRVRDHPRDQRGDLQPGVRALAGRHTQMRLSQFLETCRRANASTGTNPADDTRFVSSNTAGVA
jgi:hypothetical protein